MAELLLLITRVAVANTIVSYINPFTSLCVDVAAAVVVVKGAVERG